MVMLYKSRTQIRIRYRNKKIWYQGKKNAKSIQVSVAITHQTPSHSPYSQDCYCQPERCGSQLCPGYDCSPKLHISCSLHHLWNPTSHSTTAVHKPTSKGDPKQHREPTLSFTQVIPLLVLSPFLRDVASRQPKLITNSLGVFFSHIIILDKICNNAETIILPTSLMKLKVKETTIKDGLCIHASGQGEDLGTSP